MSGLLRPAHVRRAALSSLFTGLDVVIHAEPDADPEVGDITLDSRTVGPGTLYVALPGTKAHGADFSSAAAAQGAVAVLTDVDGRDRAEATGLPVVVCEDPRAAMALAAATLFGRPTHDLRMFGLTGTNGKTTTCFLVEAALVAAGERVGTIGTNGFRLDGEPIQSSRTTVTTPESPDLQALLAVMLERGASAVAMEVSSHALVLQRVNEVGFDVAGFTNLGRDHLDFHPTMEDYFQAKSRLFDPRWCRVAVVNTDDEYGLRLAQKLAGQELPRLVSTGFGPSDHQILDRRATPTGSWLKVAGPYGEREFTIDLPGEYNVRNAVMALAMLTEAGIDVDDAIEGLRHAQVPGRMELVLNDPDAPRCYVDFAHTPQAISAAIDAVEPDAGGRTIVVIGAGGDRDRAKRGPMGAAAARGSDLVVVTDDNPRTESPEAIRAAVVAGVESATDAGRRPEVVEVSPRREAIAHALASARAGDVVLVLGKGHERGQEIAGEVLPFDDAGTVRELWDEIRTMAGEGR